VGDSWSEAVLLGTLAEMAWELGDLERAAALARDSVSLGRNLGNAFTLVYGLGVLAAVAAAEGDGARAGRLWGAVEMLEESGEARLDPTDRGRYEAAVLASSDAQLESARLEGRAIGLDEAVEYALARGSG
jgi:hypothetical protein